MTQEMILEALARCAKNDCGDFCPMKGKDWINRGLATCEAFADGETVEMPVKLIEHVIKLLQAQEPRLVTIDDFEGADEYGWLPAWCEQQTGGAVYCECILADALKEKGIRYWTRKPTDEQREKEPWK